MTGQGLKDSGHAAKLCGDAVKQALGSTLRGGRGDGLNSLGEVAPSCLIALGTKGVDRFITQASIATTTLYRQSKDKLIVVVLRRIDEQFRNAMRQAVDTLAREPKQKLLATFDFLERWFKDEAFRLVKKWVGPFR